MHCGKIPAFADELLNLKDRATGFIFRGSQAVKGEYPWMAYVELGVEDNLGKKLFCGGVLITGTIHRGRPHGGGGLAQKQT